MGFGWPDVLTGQERTPNLELYVECPNSQMLNNAMQDKEAFTNRQGPGAQHVTLWAEELEDTGSLSLKGHLGRVEALWDS